jgi:ATP-dependent DNA helicase PIF1
LNIDYQDLTQPQGWIVAVLAPTGIAAYNINGITIHRFFKLPVFGNSDGDKHWDLSGDNLKDMRDILKNIKLIIIGKG